MEKADYWSVARTLAQREAFAADRLKETGFEVFLPLLSAGRGGAIAPMFVNYLFVNLNGAHAHWRAVDRTLGVMKLIRFGDQPGRVPDAEIAALRARADQHGVIRLPPPPSKRRYTFVKGEAVKITGGPFAGLRAVHSGMSAAEREIVLLAILGAQRQVAIDRAFVKPGA